MLKKISKSLTSATVLALMTLGVSALSTAAHAGEVTVYTALEEDEIQAYLDVARKELPDIDIKVLRLSTGDLGARLVAEADNPQADVIWGFALTNMLDPRILDMLQAYKAKGAEDLPKQYRGEDGKWFAATGYMGAFCVNTQELEAKDLPMPQSWEDLTDPAYKGEIVMPDPNSSGTGYLQVAAILQGMGEDKGWNLLQKLDKNMAQYTTSGSKPCKMARTGEYAIGASLAFVAMQSIDMGYPVKMVLPSDWEGYELEASGLMKSSDNAEDAKAFLDWTLSQDAAKLYGDYKAIITMPGTKPSATAEKAGLPKDLSKALYPMDFAKSAKDRADILSTWKSKVGG